jgi:hypothetical protein
MNLSSDVVGLDRRSPINSKKSARLRLDKIEIFSSPAALTPNALRRHRNVIA